MTGKVQRSLLFQSTLPRGERHSVNRRGTCNLAVSIHAPAGGATIGACRILICRAFQSTLPRGERPTETTILVSMFLVSIHAPAGGATRHQFKMPTLR